MNWDIPHPIEIAGLLRELAAKLLDAHDLAQALDDVAGMVHATLAMPCGISLWGVSHPLGVAARPGELVVLSEAELRAGDGPGLEAIRLREAVTCQDLAAERRWPDWREKALGHGLGSALITPLDVGRDCVATFSLYGPRAHCIDPSAEATARVLAEHTGLLLEHLLRRENDCTTDDLPVLHRASGVIMAQWGCPEDEARAILEATAAALSVPLAELANRLVDATLR